MKTKLIAELSCGHSQKVPKCCKVGSVTGCDECTDQHGPTNSDIISVFTAPELPNEFDPWGTDYLDGNYAE